MTMIERVARAIFEAWAREEGSAVTWDQIVEYNGRPGYLNASNFYRLATAEARAAIEAMREPTEAMVTARFNVLGQGGKAEWEAMIDEALVESP